MNDYKLNNQIVVLHKSSPNITDFVLYLTKPDLEVVQIQFEPISPAGYYQVIFEPYMLGVWSGRIYSESTKESTECFFNVVDIYTHEGKLKVQDAVYNPLREWQSIGANYAVVPPTAPDTFKQNIFDWRISETFAGADGQIELIGGKYYIKDKEAIDDRDVLEFSVIDKDDVLGMFEMYGMTVGTDVIELKKFITTHSVIGGQLVEFNPGQVKILPVGLYLRMSYTCYGSKPFSLKLDFIVPS